MAAESGRSEGNRAEQQTIPYPTGHKVNTNRNQKSEGSIASSLLYRAQNQDNTAWDCVNELFGPLIHGWIRKSGISDADAADISQQVLQQVFRNIGNFTRKNPSDTFTGWVWTITKFKILDHFERQKDDFNAAGGSVANQMIQQLSDEQLNADVFDEESSAVQLTRKILTLVRSEFETKTWDAFWRATVEREKPAEIAKTMDMTLHAVYKAKSRVMRRVRDELDGIVSSNSISGMYPSE